MTVKAFLIRIANIIRAWVLVVFRFTSKYPIKSIWLNFKVLPFKQAIILPITLYSKTIFRNLSGNIIIDNEHIIHNMIKLGADWWYPATARPQVMWSIYGTLIFKGLISFPQGTYLHVGENGVLQFGTKGTFLGTDSKVICFDRIIIGDNTEITWGCQIYDTSFHYVEIDGETKELTAPIIIGNNVWIGNNTTVTKGVTIPDWSIVTSHSLVNKDLRQYGEHCMFAGRPASLKKQRATRIFDEQQQKELDKHYNYSRNHL